MPGNESGDRVHNFFAPENLSQGQHQSRVLQGNLPILNNNVWVNSQIQVDTTNASNNYISQNSDIVRRQTSYPVNATNGLNISRSDLGQDFSKNQLLNEQPYTNGFMYGDQISRNRQNESNFLPVNTNSDPHHLITSRGLPVHGLQQGYDSEQQTKGSARLETSIPSQSFDIFGSRQQISHQQASMMQAMQHQQPGLNDMQHLQQQYFIKKMQDFQRQQQLQQSGLRTQDLMNQASPLNMNVSGRQSTLVTGTPNSDTLHEPGTNWLNCGSSSMQGSPSGLVIPSSVGQTQRLMELGRPQVNQSLYGVPVSSLRGSGVNHYSQMELHGSSMPQMSTVSNSQHKFLPNQNGVQDGMSSSSKKMQTENMFGHSASQPRNSGMRDAGALKRAASIQRNDPQHNSWGHKGLDSLTETFQERPLWQVASSQNEVALDPTEERILYGSDDNIWDVLGKSHNTGGEAGNLFDNGGVSNEFSSIQSGSWSALMQSAVGETSTSDLGPHEWSGVNIHNTDNFPANKPPTTSLSNDNLQFPSVLSTASIPPSADLNSLNAVELDQREHLFQSVPVQRVPNDKPHLFGQSLEKASKQSNLIPLQKVVAKGSQIDGNAPQHSFNAERSSITVPASHDNDGVMRKNMENHSKKENSNDGYHSNLPQRASGGHRENRLSEAGDSRSSVLGKQKSINQLSVKDPGHRKFQYHPMGNLDEDEGPPFGPKQPTQDLLQKDTRPFSPSTSSKASSQGQNMLELFQKLDQFGDQVVSSHLSSEGNLPSHLPTADKMDGSASGLQHAQSSGSQGFGLELGPPSLRLQTSELSSTFPNAQGMIPGAEMEGKCLPQNPSSSSQSAPFPIVESQVEFKNDRSAGLGHRGTENSLYKMRRNYNQAFSSGIPSGINWLENKQIISERMALNQLHESAFSGNSPQILQRGFAENVLSDSSHLRKEPPTSMGMNDEHDRSSAATSLLSNSQNLNNPGISELGVSSQVQNMLSKVHTPEQTFASQKNPKAPLRFSELSQSNIVESSFQGELNVGKESNLSSKVSEIQTNSLGVDKDRHRENIETDAKLEEPLRKVSPIKNHLDDSPANSASTQKDIQAFGRSLKPNKFSNEQYALLNQMGDLRDVESDPSIRVSKRIKGLDNNLDDQQNVILGQQNVVVLSNSLGLNSGVPSDGFRGMSVPTPSNSLQRNTSPNGNVASQDMAVSGLDASTNSSTSVRAENQISPQMAPSWFNQYGKFENGQMLPVYNAHQITHVKSAESPFILGKSSNVLSTLNSQEKIASTPAPVYTCQVDGTLLNSSSTNETNEHFPSPQALQLNVTPLHQVISRSNKRKTATSELHPWYKEISDDSKALSTLSVAESDWSKATNRHSEKVLDDAELIEDAHPGFRLKRRLILTTQLMQLLFCPPPANILSSDASSKYESVTYAVSMLALGDACSSVSFSRNFGLSPDGVNLHPAKGKLNRDQRFAEAIDELSGKSRKLENDFLRMDKRVSILDLRVELQELEKYSVINRFAKFHGRGQNDNAETSSTNAMAATGLPSVQRYVTALPIPKNIPDSVQCLSL